MNKSIIVMSGVLLSATRSLLAITTFSGSGEFGDPARWDNGLPGETNNVPWSPGSVNVNAILQTAGQVATTSNDYTAATAPVHYDWNLTPRSGATVNINHNLQTSKTLDAKSGSISLSVSSGIATINQASGTTVTTGGLNIGQVGVAYNSSTQYGHYFLYGTVVANAITINQTGKFQIGSGGYTAVPVNIESGTAGSVTGLGGGEIAGQIKLNSNADFRGNGVTLSGGILSSANQSISINGSKWIINTAPVNLGSGTMTFTSAGNTSANACELNVGGNDWNLMRLNFDGYLKLGGANYLPPDSDVEFGWHVQSSSSGTLNLNGYDQTVKSIGVTSIFPDMAGDQNITGGGTLTVNLPSGTKEYQGRITDGTTPTALTKEGAGTQVLENLSGTPSGFSGATTVNDGILQVNSAVSFGKKSAVTVGAGGRFVMDNCSLSFGSLAGAGIVESFGADYVPLGDDFSSGSVNATATRFYESQIDGGWITRYDGAWTIADGVMRNAATTSGGHPEACPAESALAQVVSNYGDGDTVTLKFDYDVAAGDTLYVHFWGYTGVLVNANEFIGNTEACNGHYYNDEDRTELNAFNFKDGADSFNGTAGTSISGALTGSGSYSNTIRVADLNIAGVDSMAEISYISLAFCKEENGLSGTTSVDNVSVTLSPVTLRVGADNSSTVFSGTIREGDGDSVLGFTKVGSGTQSLAGANTYSGPTVVLDGTLALGVDNALSDSTVLVLDGGTLDAGAATDTIGALDLRSDSTLNLEGCHLTFGDSTGFDWSGTLELTGSLRSTSLRFIPAITEDQILRITYQGNRVYSTEDGYIVALRGTVILVH